MKKVLLILFLFVYGLTSTSSFAAPAFAQQKGGIDITVSPSVLDVTASPGDTIKQKFRVRNNTSSPVTLKISVDKLAADQNGQILPVKATSNDTYLSWISFDTTTFSAKPNDWTEITATVALPKDAAFGYYYAIHVSQVRDAQSQNNTTNLIGEVVVPFLVTVKSANAKAQLSLISFKTNSFLSEYLPVSFSITVKNTGNVLLRPRGNIFIQTGPSEKDTALLDVNDANGAILPGATRVFTSNWTDGFFVLDTVKENGSAKLDKNGKPTTALTINWNKLTQFRIGKYTAHLLLVYDNGKRDVPLEANANFWVVPYTILGGGVVGILIIVILGRLWLSWYINQQVKRYQR